MFPSLLSPSPSGQQLIANQVGGKYGSAMIVAQNLVFISGVVGKDDSGAWVEGGIKECTKAAIANAQKRLQHIGLDLKDGMSRL